MAYNFKGSRRRKEKEEKKEEEEKEGEEGEYEGGRNMQLRPHVIHKA